MCINHYISEQAATFTSRGQRPFQSLDDIETPQFLFYSDTAAISYSISVNTTVTSCYDGIVLKSTLLAAALFKSKPSDNKVHRLHGVDNCSHSSIQSLIIVDQSMIRGA